MDYAQFTRHSMRQRLAVIHRRRRLEARHDFLLGMAATVAADIVVAILAWLAVLWLQGRT